VADPVFWLGVSILLVAVSIAAVLVAAMPAFRELARAARSAEKLFDTLSREMPPTLKAIRDTGAEISSLTDEMSDGVQSAGQVVKQVDQSISGVKQKTRVTTRGISAGFKAAWKAFNKSEDEGEDFRSSGADAPQLVASDRPAIEREDEVEDEMQAQIRAELAEQNGKTEAHLDSPQASLPPASTDVPSQISARERSL
jgi:uncharacterized protein YoxC